jgi:hypothetical protein
MKKNSRGCNKNDAAARGLFDREKQSLVIMQKVNYSMWPAFVESLLTRCPPISISFRVNVCCLIGYKISTRLISTQGLLTGDPNMIYHEIFQFTPHHFQEAGKSVYVPHLYQSQSIP